RARVPQQRRLRAGPGRCRRLRSMDRCSASCVKSLLDWTSFVHSPVVDGSVVKQGGKSQKASGKHDSSGLLSDVTVRNNGVAGLDSGITEQLRDAFCADHEI